MRLKNVSVFGMSLDDVFALTHIPIPIVIAQSIFYLKMMGGLRVEVGVCVCVCVCVLERERKRERERESGSEAKIRREENVNVTESDRCV